MHAFMLCFQVLNDNLATKMTLSISLYTRAPVASPLLFAHQFALQSMRIFFLAVIRFEFAEDPVYATEDDSEVNVCVNLTWLEGPTKRSAPILFYTEQQDGGKLTGSVVVIGCPITDAGEGG